MKHTPATDCFEIYCHMHRPFILDVEMNRSFWERIDSINQFVEGYQDLIKKNAGYFSSKLKNEELNQLWPD